MSGSYFWKVTDWREEKKRNKVMVKNLIFFWSEHLNLPHSVKPELFPYSVNVSADGSAVENDLFKSTRNF